jgi:hypothetical protein
MLPKGVENLKFWLAMTATLLSYWGANFLKVSTTV